EWCQRPAAPGPGAVVGDVQASLLKADGPASVVIGQRCSGEAGRAGTAGFGPGDASVVGGIGAAAPGAAGAALSDGQQVLTVNGHGPEEDVRDLGGGPGQAAVIADCGNPHDWVVG